MISLRFVGANMYISRRWIPPQCYNLWLEQLRLFSCFFFQFFYDAFWQGFTSKQGSVYSPPSLQTPHWRRSSIKWEHVDIMLHLSEVTSSLLALVLQIHFLSVKNGACPSGIVVEWSMVHVTPGKRRPRAHNECVRPWQSAHALEREHLRRLPIF